MGREHELETNWTRQDSIVLNITRACEQSIDMANRMIRLRRLEPADDARQAFAVLRQAHLIGPELETTMRRMVGFRNVAVHSYEELDLNKVKVIIETRLDDLVTFSREMMDADPSREPAGDL